MRPHKPIVVLSRTNTHSPEWGIVSRLGPENSALTSEKVAEIAGQRKMRWQEAFPSATFIVAEIESFAKFDGKTFKQVR